MKAITAKDAKNRIGELMDTESLAQMTPDPVSTESRKSPARKTWFFNFDNSCIKM
jgi:hypothetical protein